jgi:hypothetical protein
MLPQTAIFRKPTTKIRNNTSRSPLGAEFTQNPIADLPARNTPARIPIELEGFDCSSKSFNRGERCACRDS